MTSVIIGLDGVPYSLIKQYSDAGHLPNITSVLKKGSFVKMESSIPDVSSTAWSSVITGKNPGEHGIFGFIEPDKDTYRFKFPNFTDLKSKPFWSGKKSAIINVPQTYPAKIDNGIMVSGFVAPDLEKSVYPPSLMSIVKETGYKVDVEAGLAQNSIPLFLEDVYRTLEARNIFFEKVWKMDEWEIFYFVFTETDRMNHFLFEAWDNPAHKYYSDFIEFYKEIDKSVGEILKAVEGNKVFLHSDHGFCPLKQEVYINKWLAEKGYLKFKVNNPISTMDMSPSSTAFAMDPGRIYINSTDRFPNGSVPLSEKSQIISDLVAKLKSLKIDGVSPFSQVLLNSDIFIGSEAVNGPDIVLIGRKGYDIKSLVPVMSISGRRHFTGMHTQDDAFLITSEPLDIEEPFHVEKIAGLVKV